MRRCYNSNWDLMELRKVITSPRDTCDQIYVLLSGLEPLIGTNTEHLPMIIPTCDQLGEKCSVSLKGRILLIELEGAEKSQEVSHMWSNRMRV